MQRVTRWCVQRITQQAHGLLVRGVDLITRVAGNRPDDLGEQNGTLDGVRLAFFVESRRPARARPRVVERRRKTRRKAYRHDTVVRIRHLGAIMVAGLIMWALILSSVFAVQT